MLREQDKAFLRRLMRQFQECSKASHRLPTEPHRLGRAERLEQREVRNASHDPLLE